jgi:uncharacterized protein
MEDIMLEKIIFINDNEAKILITSNQALDEDLINLHLVFDDGERRILGEIDEVDNNIINVQFLGEFKENDFIPGVINKPRLTAKIRVISKEELDIVMSQNDNRTFNLGRSILYNNFPVDVNIDSLFNSHIAIFGNTGSGKSYGVSKIIQSLFYNPHNIALNSTIVMFDVHGEYQNAFRDINKINPNYRFKHYTANVGEPNSNLISIPIWLLDIEDIALLLGADDYSQLTIIEKTIFILSIITQGTELATKFKNHVIAKSIQTLLYSNLSAARIRSDIFEILSICSTDELNLNAVVPGIGYTREFKKCFEIGKMGTFSENVLISNYIEQFINDELEKQVIKVPGKCNLKDLEDALNFVIISYENILNNEKFNNSAMMLKMKLHSLVVGGYAKYFEYPEYVNIDGFIRTLLTNEAKQHTQLINIDIEGLNTHMASFATKTYAKLLYHYVTLLKSRASMPIHFFIEEAHRFIKQGEETVYGENIFQKISKEGRKYGVMLTLISQRPTELSETILSQCSSFLLFRTNHPRDLEYMKRAIPNINTDIIEKQRSIQPGYCVGLGRAFKIPMIMKLDLPNPPPLSSNAMVFDIWSGHNNHNQNSQ